MTRVTRALAVGTCAVAMMAATALSALTPTMARYSNATHIAVRYGSQVPVEAVQTMTADTTTYDFGCWSALADADTFVHTIDMTSADLTSGRLRFAWDDDTHRLQDVTVQAKGESVAGTDDRYVEYAVTAKDGRVQFPFAVTVADPAVGRRAILHVSWYPDGSDEPTLFSRYLLALVADAEGTDVPTFVEKKTKFLTDQLLRVTLTTPDAYSGVCLSVTDGEWAASTRYYTDTYPAGVTLLRDSALYVDRTAEETELLLDLSAQLSGDRDPVSLSVGVSDALTSHYTVTSSDADSHLTATLSHAASLVKVDAPLTITITEPTSFRDEDWTTMDGTAVDLSWSVDRRFGDTFRPVKLTKDLTVTAQQTDVGGTLTIAVKEGTQPAGTYRLTVTQYYKGYPVIEKPIWFFIDYR